MSKPVRFHHTLIVPELYAHERLDQALAQLISQFSRSQLKNWIDAGQVLVNGKICKPKMKLRGGETILINAPVPQLVKVSPQAIKLSIIYEDETLIIINKPVGMVVHPGAGNQDQTLVNALLHHSPSLNLLPRAGILHRLDKNTSGLLLIAKTAEAFKDLGQQLKKRTLMREYQAIVYGILISGGTINAPIARDPINRKKMTVIATGKPATTHYRVLERYRAHTRLKVKLDTGRTHQIRVHMQHIHHPIVGDPTYGGSVRLTKAMSAEFIQALRHFNRQALHACALGFKHPLSQQDIRIEVDLPNDMQILIQLLKKDMEENQ